MATKRKITITLDGVSDETYAAFANGLWYFASASVTRGDFNIGVPASDVAMLNKQWNNDETPRWEVS
jgi:hypothetical protein